VISIINIKSENSYQISMGEIISKLETSEYKGRYKICDTDLAQNDKRWRRGYKSKFQQSLVDDNLKFFAYIKFYLDEGKRYALVAGKSGSYAVNSSGCDLRFLKHPYKGEAKIWLSNNDKEWCQTEILVISTISEDDKESEKEAYRIEKYLAETFGLKGS